MDIALAYREVETAEKLLADVVEARSRHSVPDIRDAFGRLQGGLQLGVPMGTGHTLYNVPWSIAKPIIETHIAHHRAAIAALTEKAKAEMALPPEEQIHAA
jgi:hypothetical protein